MLDLFSSDVGKKIFTSAKRAINEYAMDTIINEGVLLGLSGGADSVMLLHLLIKLKSEGWNFPLLCVHINHMIRGAEADRDEAFCRDLCASVGVELIVRKIDVPSIAKSRGVGMEEAARDVRYAEFSHILSQRDDVSSIAVAHNATDNLETIIFNMMRGAGISGLCGIKPTRDNIFRPLIAVSKADIVNALDISGIQYVTDSTNLENDYTRNYIRNEIIPRLSRLTPSPEAMGSRVSKNLLYDKEILDKVTSTFLNNEFVDGRISLQSLKKLNKSEFYRALSEIVRQKTNKTLERCHTDAIYDLLSTGSFRYSLPGKLRFVSNTDVAYIEDDVRDSTDSGFNEPLFYGVNRIEGFSSAIIISNDDDFESYSNIYKIAIQARMPFDIMCNGVYVRNKCDGDSYFYGGINRKLKKLFNDAAIPREKRNDVPVVCDQEGILWVPGFGVRCEEDKHKGLIIAFAEDNMQNNLRSFYIKKR